MLGEKTRRIDPAGRSCVVASDEEVLTWFMTICVSPTSIMGEVIPVVFCSERGLEI